MVIMQPSWRWSTYKFFSTMVVCKIIMAFLGWFCLLVLIGLVYLWVTYYKMLLSKFKFNLFHSWLVSIVWHTRQPWLPKPFKFAHYINQWKGREDFENKGLENIEQCQNPHDFYVEPIQKNVAMVPSTIVEDCMDNLTNQSVFTNLEPSLVKIHDLYVSFFD